MAHSPVVISVEAGWVQMEVGIEKVKRILAAEPDVCFPAGDCMHLYTTIYNICTLKQRNYDYSRQLYDRYKEALENYITSTVLPSLKEKHGQFLLRDLVKGWRNYMLIMKWLGRFLTYLDRYFIPQAHLGSLSNVGLGCFTDLVFQEVKEKVTRIVIDMIDEDREGHTIDLSLVKNVIEIYVQLGEHSYVEDFEDAFHSNTIDYYYKKTQTWILEYSCPEYMLKVDGYLQDEKERAMHCLHSSTESKLMEDLHKELSTTPIEQIEQILWNENSGCRVLFRGDKVEDLSRIFRILSRIDGGLLPVSKIFKEHINEEGMSLLEEETNAPNQKEDFVRKILELHDKYIAYVTDCFQDHPLFHKAFKEAFEVFCNKKVADCSSAELFAAYSDSIIRKSGAKKLSDEVIEENLDKVVKLLMYINDKDLFAEFHRKKLGRRLVLDKGDNNEHDKSMLSKLKLYFGGVFTAHMEGMLTDVTVAKEQQMEYQEYTEANPESHPLVDLNVQVLTTGFWPTYKSTDINLPPEMVQCVEGFKEFYGKKWNQCRKLTWIYSLGTCNIIGHFKAKPIELITTTYQLTDEDIVGVLHSLSCAKYKILNKRPSNKMISPSDVFEFNHKFTDKLQRIKIPPPLFDEKKRVVDDVNMDRNHAIDAALMRIMKSRKFMTHQNLVVKCVEQLSRMFKPNIKMVKRRINDLINRDYLERDRDAPNSYRYLA